MKIITWPVFAYLISISCLVKSLDLDNGLKEKAEIKNTKKIFDFFETDVLELPITPFGSLDKNLVRSLIIDYPKYEELEENSGFDLNDFFNMYEGYDNTYIRKLLRAENGNTDDKKNYHINDAFYCEESQDRCAYRQAHYLLNKVNSTQKDKYLALNILESVESTVPDALFLLGVLYENYDIFFDDKSSEHEKLERNLKSLVYYKQGAEQGDSNCQLVMAHKYLMGQDVSKDITKANIIQYSVLKKEIKEAANNSRFLWFMNHQEHNLWNHNYYKFLHDPDYKEFNYVAQDSKHSAISKDSKISLANVNSKEMLADHDLIATMVTLKNFHLIKVMDNKITEKVENQLKLSTFSSLEKQVLLNVYRMDEIEYLSEEIIRFLYSDLFNSYKGNMFSSFKDYQYVFEFSKKLIIYLIDNQEFVEKNISKVGKYYLKEILIMFANIYKEYGIYDKNDLKKIDLVLSVYKEAQTDFPKSTAPWESFKFLSYLRPNMNLTEVFYTYLALNVPDGYCRLASTAYVFNEEIEKIYKNKNFDEAVRTNAELYSVLQSKSSFIPLLYEDVNLSFMISTKHQAIDQSNASNKLRRLLNQMQMNCNIDIFKQNFVNVMNYLLKNDQELNLFAMAQLASMGFVPAISNLANELIQPIKIFNDTNPNLSREKLNIGVSKYMASYKFGDLNQGLCLSDIFEEFGMYSEMLSLNHLIAETDGTFYSYYNLARIYEYGYGVKQNYDVAAEYYKKAFDVKSIQFFHNAYKCIEGLEISIQILLWKLKCKKIIDRIGLSMLGNKVLNSILSFFSVINNKFLNFNILKLHPVSITMSLNRCYGETPLLYPILISLAVGSIGYFFPAIIRYLARTLNWTIEINGVQFVDGAIVEREDTQ